jgi:hypothetical protein
MTGCSPSEFEADREWLLSRHRDDERRLHALQALRRVAELQAGIFARTGGEGIPGRIIQEALDEAQEH